jgi:hypothetical protein
MPKNTHASRQGLIPIRYFVILHVEKYFVPEPCSFHYIFFRRNWKRRWFVLKDTILTYHENDAEGAKPLGSIDLKNCQ